MTTSNNFFAIFRHIRDRFELHSDMDDKENIQKDVSDAVALKGTNLWVLIFAIIIASIGLNTNSTAVIIGAMLISPLMGPIIGFGFGLSIHDFELVKKSVRNLLFAVGISLLMSTFYFLFSPLSEAHSEILARTTPTIWDVAIALSGGLAGMIANTRKTPSTAVPGVAIATALMPPICTAGYGIATLQASFFFGAMYLFFINSIFIALGTMIIVHLLKLNTFEIKDAELSKKINKYILITIILTILPSIYLAYRIVRKEVLDQKIKKFIQLEIKNNGGIVLDKHISRNQDIETLDITLISSSASNQKLLGAKEKFKYYGIKDVDLKMTFYNNDENSQKMMKEIMANIDHKPQTDATLILQKQLETIQARQLTEENEIILLNDIEKELTVQLDKVKAIHLGFSKNITANNELSNRIILATIKSMQHISKKQKTKIEEWLKIRSKSNDAKILWE